MFKYVGESKLEILKTDHNDIHWIEFEITPGPDVQYDGEG